MSTLSIEAEFKLKSGEILHVSFWQNYKPGIVGGPPECCEPDECGEVEDLEITLGDIPMDVFDLPIRYCGLVDALLVGSPHKDWKIIQTYDNYEYDYPGDESEFI